MRHAPHGRTLKRVGGNGRAEDCRVAEDLQKTLVRSRRACFCTESKAGHLFDK
jgi:hypothetical protein